MLPRFRFRPRLTPLGPLVDPPMSPMSPMSLGTPGTPVSSGAPGPAGARDPVDVLLAAFAGSPGLAVLDSAGGRPSDFSLVAFDPLEEIGRESDVPDLARLREFASRLSADAGPGGDSGAVPGPFHGGFIGALAYELGIDGERLELPAHRWATPPVVGGLYCDYVVVDHRRGRCSLVLGDEPGDGRAPWPERRDRALERIHGALTDGSPIGTVEPQGPLVRRVQPHQHCARIDELRARIAQGELYQANLAHPFSVEVAGDPVDLYRRLRRVNPAPYAGFLRWRHGRGEGAILSASPELLLELDPERARTRPIKGTVARGVDARRDAEQRARLLASEKDLAELAMIVDLERNDLGRIARPGSVRVEGFPSLESYAAVHHLVADVVAQPRAGVDAFDVVAALFPGGSITGAPKIASMRAIADLEREGRGFFTGSLGFVDTRGRARLNILIRTLDWRPTPESGREPGRGIVGFHVGGGITWSSDARAEERETLDKGSALAAALFGAAADGAGLAPLEGFGSLAPLWSSEPPRGRSEPTSPASS